MESHEVLRSIIQGPGAKSVAADMGLSPSLIYKWCEAKGLDASGADNPLDRLLRLCEVTRNLSPILWLCEQVNGFFIENLRPDGLDTQAQVLDLTRRILREFSEMLDSVSQSMSNDNGIDAVEARRIRAEWEDLKRIGEQFVLGCEAGTFAPRTPDPQAR